MGRRAILVILEKRKFPCHCQDSNPRPPNLSSSRYKDYATLALILIIILIIKTPKISRINLSPALKPSRGSNSRENQRMDNSTGILKNHN